MLNRRIGGQVEATKGQRPSCQSLKNARRLKEHIHVEEKRT
jgi:hypothetical protein